MLKVFMFFAFLLTISHAQEELTFRQVMQIVNSATLRILQGFLLNNDELVVRGAEEIARHPMPKGGPIQYIDPSKRAEFLRAMPTFERQVHGSAEEITKLMREGKKMKLTKSSIGCCRVV
jgi:hypothetical protein